MKILFIDAFHGFGGAQVFNASLLREFQNFGHTTVLICRKKSRLLTMYSGKYFTLPFLGDLDIFSFIGIVVILVREKPDIVHTHSHHDHWLGALAARLCHIPVVHTRHVAFSIKLTLIARVMFDKCADRIITVSNYTKTKLLETFSHLSSFDVSKVVTVPCIQVTKRTPVIGKFRKDIECGEKKIINYIARMVPGKGHCYFIDALECVCHTHTDIVAVFVGDGPMYEEIQHMVHDKKLTNYIRFAGFRNDMENIYADSYLSVIASENESLSFTAMDSLYHGIPVIASDVGGIPEVVTSHENGILFPVGDSKKLAQIIDTLLTQESFYLELKEKCNRYREKIDSEPHSAQKFIIEYEKIIGRKK